VIGIAAYIDHTVLKPTTTHIEIKTICEEAMQYGFAAVCVPPPLVRVAGNWLAGAITGDKPDSGIPDQGGHRVKVATVIGFPFGYSTVRAKLAEAEQAIADGADELDTVINLVHLKNREWDLLEKEMNAVTELAHDHNRIVKVIIESGILLDEEIIRCCEIYGKLGVDYLKTSTGYAEKGATLEAVRLMREHLPADIHIKASGGIRQFGFAKQLIEAGADRLGCSASVAIMQEERELF
jgi:deoxyribose-phosphate aldolase